MLKTIGRWAAWAVGVAFTGIVGLCAYSPSELIAKMAEWAIFLRLDRLATWLSAATTNQAVQTVSVGILCFLAGILAVKAQQLWRTVAVATPRIEYLLEPDLPLRDALDYIVNKTKWGADLIREKAKIAQVEVIFKDKVVHAGLCVWGRQGNRAINIIDPHDLNDEEIDFANSQIGRTWSVWTDVRVCKKQIEAFWPPLADAGA